MTTARRGPSLSGAHRPRPTLPSLIQPMTRAFRLSLVALAMLAAVPAHAHAQAAAATPASPVKDPEKRRLIDDLLARTKAVDLALQSMESSIGAQRMANPRIPAVFWDRFIARAKAERGEFAAMIGGIWDRHFTTAELRELLAFYDTPVGKKTLEMLPAISQESMVAGQQWGQRLGMEIGAELEAEGVKLAP